jgi:threonine dehydratase
MSSSRSTPLPLHQVVRPTTIVESARLSKYLNVNLTLASETFQHTGSFKFRAAYNLASKVPNRELIAASSGNFGQALAYASALLKKHCIIVMPDKSAQVKIDAVREYGGIVDLIDVRTKTRAQRVAELSHLHPLAYTTNAYDDPLIIEGNASLGAELVSLKRHFDYLIVPVGGGGLSSGLVSGIQQSGKSIPVIAAEPALANRTARSLKVGALVQLDAEPQTIADGARTISLGKSNWAILQHGLAGVVEVTEEKIREALGLLYSHANLKTEPTGALSVAAVMTQPERFLNKSICCVVSGGNVDVDVFTSMLKKGPSQLSSTDHL